MTFSTASCVLPGSPIRMAIPSNLFNGDTETRLRDLRPSLEDPGRRLD